MPAALVCCGAFAAASVNAAIVVLRLLGRADPRAAGSGNAGASNVYRVAGPGWAAVVLLLDVGRAAALGWLALLLLPAPQVPLVGLALVAGNRWPPLHGFRGGKGVAAWLGFTVALQPLGAAFACLAWLVVRALGRVTFVGSLAMVVVLAGGVVSRCGTSAVSLAGTALTLILVVSAHRPNFRTSAG